MTLIKSISGIRGTIGGNVGDAFTPLDIVKFTLAYGTWLKNGSTEKKTVVIGRDARISGEMVRNIVVGALQGVGIDVLDLGLSTTPTVEVAVTEFNAHGGIILTASHNPKQWNALKLLNEKGEFISGADGAKVLEIADKETFQLADVDNLGSVMLHPDFGKVHLQKILDLPEVDVEAIRKAKFKVAVDAVNSTGGIFIPQLLELLGVDEVHPIYCDPTGHFPHNPEPLAAHLTDISNLVVEKGAHLGIVVDPDVDRLALVCEDGSMFGEEYTLVAVADYLLGLKAGSTVSNLSSSRALADVAKKHNSQYFASAVGEVNVVETMKKVGAEIGGEGNGGIIMAKLHYGRDALVGIALFLTHLAKKGVSATQLRASYPAYFMGKNKIELTPGTDVDSILGKLAEKYKAEKVNTIDGVKIDFAEAWVHFRKSNTEPIIRIYSEAKSQEQADAIGEQFIKEIQNFL
ncbi:MAG: phosphoglucosamine mutase [Luteibaculaceae bacterium]